jgi:hypothetical protein
MAMLVTIEAQAFSHVISMCYFIKAIYIHHVIIVLLLGFRLGAIVSVLVGIGKGDSGVSSVDIAINLHDSSEILIEVVRNIPHHMDSM